MRGRRSARRWSLPVAAGVAGQAPDLPIAARILGLDPGSLATGYAVIECANGKTKYLTSGCIRTGGGQFPDRLAQIFKSTAQLTSEWRPEEVAIERVFVHRNADSALKLGQARGAALCGVLTDSARVFEYSAREVKQAVVGTGAAQKEQVQLMVKHLLGLSGTLAADAADAIAIALCHAHMRRSAKLLSIDRLNKVAR